MRIRRILSWAVASLVAIAAVPVVLFILYFGMWQPNKAWLYSGDGIAYQGKTGVRLMLVTLGEIDLSQPTERVFHFSRVPYEVFAGIRTPGAENVPKAGIRFILRNERGEIVFDEHHRLDSWDHRTEAEFGAERSKTQPVKETTLFWRNGATREVPIGGGSVRIERLSVRADSGWGTHFEPRLFGRYELRAQVVAADPTAGPATVVLRSVPQYFP